jgi:acyl-CoA synthetase (AMP-forming)/AMP-acid ligase II
VDDRLGDVIVSGGENVLPAEVEEVLLSHPQVADAAAVGRADSDWQEAVAAVVVLRAGAATDAEELRRHCSESLASYKVPKRFEFVSELPRTASGKLLRRALR